MPMESENGVLIEDEKNNDLGVTNGEGAVQDVKEEDDNDQASKDNGAPETVMEAKEKVNASGAGNELSRTNSKSKTINSSKFSKSNTSRNSKSTRNQQDSSKGSAVLARKPRGSLSQSLSFPARPSHPDGMRRSSDWCPTKLGAKNSQTNVGKTEVSLSNGTFSSGSRSNQASKGAKTNSVGAVSRRTALASLPCLRQSLSTKPISSNGTAKMAMSEESVNQTPESIKTSVPAKGDDDARSTTSSSATPGGQLRISATGFSSRLEERAEKRKEFFSKLEEKIHAKEEEKCNLQAKSKENQDAEIKQLRKSLTFKATPMPNFYKEPPPKLELKKIPTTRPISPKLGRPKNSRSESSENGATSNSPKMVTDKGKSSEDSPANGDKINAAATKTLRRAYSKRQSRESSAAKTEGKTVKTKSKPAGVNAGKACAEKSEDILNEASEDNGGPTSTSSNPELEIPVVS